MRYRAALLGVVAFLSFAYFYEAGGWNQNSRFDVVRAIVERGQLSINQYVGNTGDRAACGTQICSDKAPGAALTAVPLVYVAHLLGISTSDDTGLYLCGLGAAAIPAALAVLTLFFAAMSLGASPGGAGFSAATLALGTPMWAYATLFFGHALATSCLVFAFAAAVSLRKPGRDFLRALAVGLAAGWAVVTEFPCAPPAVFLALLALANVERGRRLRVAGGVLAGALAAGSVLLAYDWAAFGSPFHIGYATVQGFAGMKQGIMGVTYPKLDVLFEILLGRYRGLLLIAPVLALAPFGFVLLWRASQDNRRSVIAAVAIVVYFILLNASYAYWDGGWSYGPRHMSPALPFLALALAPLWTRASIWLRRLLAALALVGVGAALICVSVISMPQDTFKHPFGDLLFPNFFRGGLGINRQTALMPSQATDAIRPHAWHASWNFGDLMGLHGIPSLLPLLVVWAAALGLWWHWRDRADVRPPIHTRRQ